MNLKEHFLLDPSVVFLNHGSFGATPKPVLEAYQNWQLRLERQPVLFLGREYDMLLRGARLALGEYLSSRSKKSRREDTLLACERCINYNRKN